MTIDEVYRFCNYVANKNASGKTFRPSDFNLLAKVAQLDFISKRLGNPKTLGPTGVPPFGYGSNRKIHEDLRPLIYGPIGIPIQANTGLFQYPYNYIWPDSVHKLDWSPIREVASDEYPTVKKNTVITPDSDYPVVVHRGPYGFIDPYTIGTFGMSYLRAPQDPYWNFTGVAGQEVYNPIGSVDFQVNQYTNAHFEICCLILSAVGINLSTPELITAWADYKEKTTG
jgi:hypothetical protein